MRDNVPFTTKLPAAVKTPEIAAEEVRLLKVPDEMVCPALSA